MKGIYIVKRHARLIWDRNKKIILKKKPLPKGYLNKSVYLVDNKFIYGILKLKNPTIIGMSEFKKLYSKHFISDKEREKWWGDLKKFYLYKFKIVKLYKRPIIYKYKRGYQTVIKKVVRK